MTDFEITVLVLCDQIPRGCITTYGRIAAALGKPGSSRAVGTALSKNPLAPSVPCHRVLPQTLRLGGYYGSTTNTNRKLELLLSEGVLFSNGHCTSPVWDNFTTPTCEGLQRIRDRINNDRRTMDQVHHTVAAAGRSDVVCQH